MRAKLLFILLPLMLLGQAQAGDPGRKWRISVGWSYFLSNGGEKLPARFLDNYTSNQKGPNYWFFPLFGFEYEFKSKWFATTSVTLHPYMLITKYQVARDVYSWKEGNNTLGVEVGPTLSWSSRDERGFNYKFTEFSNDNFTDHNLEPAAGFWGGSGGIYYKIDLIKIKIRFSILSWFSQSFIRQLGGPYYNSNFFYYSFKHHYYNNPLNDYFISDKSNSDCLYCGGYKLKTVYFQGILLGITLLL